MTSVLALLEWSVIPSNPTANFLLSPGSTSLSFSLPTLFAHSLSCKLQVTPGSLAMIPLDHKGAIDPETVPLIVQDEQMPILDFALNPFDDFSVVTSGMSGEER